MIKTAIILALGSKKHQSQLIYNRPRTMLPALGKPLTVRVMDRLYRFGIEKFFVILGEKESHVANYLNTRWHPNVDVEFVLKKDAKPIGPVLSDIAVAHPEPFFIFAYNSFTQPNFTKRLYKYHMLSTQDLIISGADSSLSHSTSHHYVSLAPASSTKTTTNLKYRAAPQIGQLTSERSAIEDEALILTNIAACGTDFVRYLAQESAVIAQSHTFVEIIQHYFNAEQRIRVARTSWTLQVEADTDLLTLHNYLLDELNDAHILSELPYTVRVKSPVRIDPRVSIGQGAVIGPYVYIEEGASIGRNAHIRNAVILKNATVEANEKLDGVVISTRDRIYLEK